jgi:hypothetical protein
MSVCTAFRRAQGDIWNAAERMEVHEGYGCLYCFPGHNCTAGSSAKALRDWLEFKKLAHEQIKDQEVLFTEFESEVLALINEFTPLDDRANTLATVLANEIRGNPCINERELLPALPDRWDILEFIREEA